jgi:hypothetical protein
VGFFPEQAMNDPGLSFIVDVHGRNVGMSECRGRKRPRRERGVELSISFSRSRWRGGSTSPGWLSEVWRGGVSDGQGTHSQLHNEFWKSSSLQPL